MYKLYRIVTTSVRPFGGWTIRYWTDTDWECQCQILRLFQMFPETPQMLRSVSRHGFVLFVWSAYGVYTHFYSFYFFLSIPHSLPRSFLSARLFAVRPFSYQNWNFTLKFPYWGKRPGQEFASLCFVFCSRFPYLLSHVLDCSSYRKSLRDWYSHYASALIKFS